MTLSVTRRIHIAPQGYEVDRITLPAIDRDAERVVLLAPQNDDNDREMRCRERIQEAFASEDIEVGVIECDLFSVDEALAVLLRTIRAQDSDDDIKVNVSAGSKITAIAGMIACMITGAEPYYVLPDEYEPSSSAVSEGMEELVPLPAFPFTEPDYQLLEVLGFIHDEQPDDGVKGVLLKDIGGYLLDNDLPAVENVDKSSATAEDIYPTVNREIITPLQERDWITVTHLSGSKHVRTTEQARSVIESSSHLVEQSPW